MGVAGIEPASLQVMSLLLYRLATLPVISSPLIKFRLLDILIASPRQVRRKSWCLVVHFATIFNRHSILHVRFFVKPD